MPKKPMTQSQYDGKPKYYKKPRKKYKTDSFYNSARWQRLRKAYRTRHPLCELCLMNGRTTAARLVHHVVEIRDGGSATAWDNLQSLCNDCHAKMHPDRFKAKGGGTSDH